MRGGPTQKVIGTKYEVEMRVVLTATVPSRLAGSSRAMNRLKQSISGMPSLPSFGKAPGDEERPTPPPLPTSTLALIQTRGATLKAVQSTFQVLHKTLAKQRPDARTGSGLGTTASPSRWVAEAMVEGSEELAGLAELSDAQQSYGAHLVPIPSLQWS